jgi:glycosyltransferase involved in cell wall biosynthesis
MDQHYHIIGVASGKDRLQQVKDREGIQTIHLEMTRTISPFKDLVAVYKLYEIIKREQPFMVHSHTPKAGIIGMLAAKLAGVDRRLHTVAGMPLLEASGFKRKILDAVEKLTYKYATLVLPNSLGLQEIILKNKYTQKNKLKVVGKGSSNGIDTAYFDPALISEEEKTSLKQSLNIQPNDTVFVFVGRIVKDKGINELVNAFITLLKTNPNSKLLLIGPYEEHLDPLNETTNTLIKNTKNILNLGRQTDIRAYLAISHALTFPSYREGFPNVVLEASAMNLPCIVTNINGCNEIITNKENGLIVPTKDEPALLEAMLFMANNSDKRKVMVENSRQNIVDNYQRPYIWNELLKLYQSLE